MNCKKIFYLLPLSIVLALGGCTSSKVEETNIPSQEEHIEQPEKPIEVFEKDDPADIKFVKTLRSLLNKGDNEGALALFDKLPEELRNDVDLRYLEASLSYSQSKIDKAEEICNYILSIDANHKDTYELLSLIYRVKGDKIKASKLNDEILKTDPYNPSVNIQKAEDQVLRKRWPLAKTYYSRALQGDPNNIDALYGYAKMLYYTDDLDNAEKALFKILDMDPTNAQALAYLGTIQFDRENYLKACQFVELSLRYDPNNYSNLIDYGKYLRNLGRYDEAVKAWEKAITIDDTYFEAYANLAGVYDQQFNDYEKALEYYYKVVEVNPKYFYAYENIAILEYHLENYQAAADNFMRAYSYRDTYDYALMASACYIKLGNEMEAKKILKRQLSITPDPNSTEYALVRFFHDTFNKNAYNNLKRKIAAEPNSNIRGKYNFYLGLYNELYGGETGSNEYYAQVASLTAPMFFEFRLAQWGLEK